LTKNFEIFGGVKDLKKIEKISRIWVSAIWRFIRARLPSKHPNKPNPRGGRAGLN